MFRIIRPTLAKKLFNSFSSQNPIVSVMLVKQAFDPNFRDISRDKNAKINRQVKMLDKKCSSTERLLKDLKLQQNQLIRQKEDLYRNKKIHDKTISLINDYLDFVLRAVHSSITGDWSSLIIIISEWPQNAGYPDEAILDFYKLILAPHGITFKLYYAPDRDWGGQFRGLTFDFSKKITPLTFKDYESLVKINTPELNSWVSNFNAQLRQKIEDAETEISQDIATLENSFNDKLREHKSLDDGFDISYTGCDAAFKRFKNTHASLSFQNQNKMVNVIRKPLIELSPQCKR